MPRSSVDLNGSSLAPAQPQLSRKALIRQREFRAEGAEAVVESAGSSVVDGSISAEVGDYSPHADASVVEVVNRQTLPSIPPATHQVQTGCLRTSSQYRAEPQFTFRTRF